jgi:hypothetical protein
MYRRKRASRSSESVTSPAAAPRPRKREPQATLDNLSASAGKSARTRRDLEQESHTAARRVAVGDQASIKRREVPATPLLDDGGGRPLRPESRELAERSFGVDASRVRVHDDHDAAVTTAALGARAFADGSHVWLGAGERESDRELLAHELAHVAQGEPGIYLRSATWLERRAWLAFFDHYLPRKFLNNYMDDTANPITLTQQEMTDVNPIVNIRRSAGFAAELAALQAQVKASNAAGAPVPAIKYIEVSGPGQALTNGTLGNFTIHYKGALTVSPDGNWSFIGAMDFYDYWDFDPKPFGTSGRSTPGELKTRVGAHFIPGSPFHIYSVDTICVQSGTDRAAVWAGGTPVHVPDKAGRTGADIATGDVGGGDVGAEVGAQASEDLNK